MNFDFQAAFNVLLSFSTAGVAWWARTVWNDNKELRTSLGQLREDIPKSYVAKEDYRSDMHEVKRLLESIRDILDRKADK